MVRNSGPKSARRSAAAQQSASYSEVQAPKCRVCEEATWHPSGLCIKHQESEMKLSVPEPVGVNQIRITEAVKEVLNLFLNSRDGEVYGYMIMDSLNFTSAKTYRILSRLTEANWLIRSEDHVKGNAGRLRVTYSVAPFALDTIKAALADAEERERRGSKMKAHGPYLELPK